MAGRLRPWPCCPAAPPSTPATTPWPSTPRAIRSPPTSAGPASRASSAATVDIGAFESSGFTLIATAGNDQFTLPGTAFTIPLQLTVRPNNAAEPVDGGIVTLAAPVSGPSATLSPPGPLTITSGTASVMATANDIPGGPYAITATATGASPTSFFLTNEPSSLLVTTLADSPTQGYLTLRNALANAAVMGGNPVIGFESGLTGTIDLGSGLVIGSSVTIDGPGPAVVTVSGGGPSSNFSVFTVEGGVTAGISGLTIDDGESNEGGGIFNFGALTLADAILSGNSATGGGAIYNGGSLTLTDATVSGNSGSDGGGIAQHRHCVPDQCHALRQLGDLRRRHRQPHPRDIVQRHDRRQLGDQGRRRHRQRRRRDAL